LIELVAGARFVFRTPLILLMFQCAESSPYSLCRFFHLSRISVGDAAIVVPHQTADSITVTGNSATFFS
jgi:hypothetical protein